jgi:hypothetical protein
MLCAQKSAQRRCTVPFPSSYGPETLQGVPLDSLGVDAIEIRRKYAPDSRSSSSSAFLVTCIRHYLRLSSPAFVMCWCSVLEGMWELLLLLFIYCVVGFSITVNLAINFSVWGTHLSCICLVIARRVVVFVIVTVMLLLLLHCVIVVVASHRRYRQYNC